MKALIIVKYTFAIIGIGLLFGGAKWFSSTSDFLDSALTADGVVVDLISSRDSEGSITYKPVVHYTLPDGRELEHVSSTSSNPPSYQRGEAVTVFYAPNDPHDAKLDGLFSLWGGPLILTILGGVFFAIGGTMVLVGIIKGNNIKHLKEFGSPVMTQFQSVERNTSLTVNGRNPYQIYSQWNNPTTGEIHIFKSENLWFDPTDHIEDQEITVLIKRDNPKKYYMDVSFLPKLAD